MLIKGGKTFSKSKMIFKSPVTENKMFNGRNRFNRPIQCGSDLPIPYNTKVFSTKVANGDMIVMASDGLWDNMSNEQVLDHMRVGVHRRDLH